MAENEGLFTYRTLVHAVAGAAEFRTSKDKIKKTFDTAAIEMVEETVNKAKNKTARPRPVYLWTVADVQKWLRRHCSDYYALYCEKFQQHDITGRALVRITETTLLRLGIENPVHRQEIWREILKLRLKTDIIEIRDLERRNNLNYE